MRTVELLFDDELEAAVRAAWERLAPLGVGSLAGHPHPTNRPHVTLAAGPSPLPAGLPALPLPALPPPPARAALPMPVALDGTLLLGRVLAWRVVPTPELLALHDWVWRRMDDPNPLHAPGAWVPHVSLARKAPPGFAFAAGTRTGSFVAARSYDSGTRTVREIG